MSAVHALATLFALVFLGLAALATRHRRTGLTVWYLFFCGLVVTEGWTVFG